MYGNSVLLNQERLDSFPFQEEAEENQSLKSVYSAMVGGGMKFACNREDLIKLIVGADMD